MFGGITAAMADRQKNRPAVQSRIGRPPLRHARTLIHQAYPGQLTALLSPQHGFYAEKQDNMIESGNGRDPVLQIPVYSLYGKTRIPTPDMLDDVDVLMVDLQDAGTRVYTFIYTLSYCMEAAKDLGKTVVVLDRPNPVNGRDVEGNCPESPVCLLCGASSHSYEARNDARRAHVPVQRGLRHRLPPADHSRCRVEQGFLL